MLAPVISVPRRTLADFRRRLKIPAWQPLVGLEHLLGKMPDAQLAKRAGCSTYTVMIRRRQRGISPVSKKKAHADRLLRAYVDEVDRFFNS